MAMDPRLVIFVSLVYVAGLFGAAWAADHRRFAHFFERHAITIYALALTVYCTSWTFFGAVGTAAVSGWRYLPIYLGPALVFVFAIGFLRRIVDICKEQNITTLSGFLAARYGHSRTLAAAVTAILSMGALPYIALQLKSVATSFSALTSGNFSAWGDGALELRGVFITAGILAGFAIAFGARTSNTAGGNRGLLAALAIEALVKLLALVIVAIAATLVLTSAGPLASVETTARPLFAPGPPSFDFIVLTLLSMFAVIALPRQFHVLTTEAPREREASGLSRARWAFPLYLAVTSVVVIPIVLAGLRVLPGDVSPDLFVLALPAAIDMRSLALIAFIGGLSAATGMITVSTIALSTMITHDLVVPILMRLGWADAREGPVERALVTIRRAVIIALMVLAALYLTAAGGRELLAQIGLVAFVAAAQLAPALVSAVYWTGARREGALAGIVSGGAIWFYTLVYPSLIGLADGVGHPIATAFGGVFNPHGLLGVSGVDPITHATVMSLTVNIAAFVYFSRRARPRLIDQVQAAAFTQADDQLAMQDRVGERAHPERSAVLVSDLRALAERFLSRDAVSSAFEQYGVEYGDPLVGDAPSEWSLVQHTERLLAGALGASTARVVIASALSSSNVRLTDVLSVLDETRHVRRFNRTLLQAALENIGQGVSVIDQDLRLVAWNRQYLEMFKLPAGLVQVGRAIDEVLRYTAERGEMGAGEPNEQIDRRLAFYRAGARHSFERENRDGRIVRIEGYPMPGGGYVTTFTDVTVERDAERALRDAKNNLQVRVEQRTQELQNTAEERDAARRRAELSEATKTRFLAAASHDLQQPLNAARLFAGAAARKIEDPELARLVGNIDRSIQSADAMLQGLLDLSRFEADGYRATIGPVALRDVFEELALAHDMSAKLSGLEFRVRPTALTVQADRNLLRSILQNLISNALRYTQAGGVLLAARKRDGGETAEVGVWDTGPGIADEALSRIFEEFARLVDVDRSGQRGAGLGLAIAARAAELQRTSISVASAVGRGSRFSVRLPLIASPDVTPAPDGAPPAALASEGRLRVLCLDDDVRVLEAMKAVLDSFGCDAFCARDAAELEAMLDEHAPFDAMLFDHQLAGDETGLALFDALQASGRAPAKTALLTANSTEALRAAARAQGVKLLPKPVDPGLLNAFVRG